MKLQQAKGSEANRIKGCLTFLRNKTKKSDMYYNELIDELIKTEYYKTIYEKYVENNNINIEDIPIKDFDILNLLDFIEPDMINIKYRGITLKTIIE
jgi:hypothetical protein